jgi:hypothetical protein
MRPARLVALIVVLGLSAFQTDCSTAPDLTGSWQWEYNQNPSGSSMTLFLREASGTVTGTGSLLGVGPRAVPDTVTISGSRLGTSFGLHLTSPSGTSIAYAGQVVGNHELRGTWILAPATTGSAVIFYRQ